METTVLQSNLEAGLNIVKRAIENRPTLPVMGNVLLSARDKWLTLAALDMGLGLGITVDVGAQTETEGGITLPAKTLFDLVARLSDFDPVSLKLNAGTQTVTLKSGRTKSNIKGISAEEYPELPLADDPDFTLPAATLKQMIAETAFAATTSQNRPVLTGVYVRYANNTLTFAAADGYRLAVRMLTLEQGLGEAFEIVAPAKALIQLARIIGDSDENIAVSLGQDRIVFQLPQIVVSVMLLDGKFPDFERIIPKNHTTESVMYREDLLRACKRAEIFARDNAFSGKFVVSPPSGPGEAGMVTVASKSQERGSNEGVLDASVEGDVLDISFNISYLIDVLNVLKGEERVVMKSNGPSNPGLVQPQSRDDYLYVVMPLSTTR